MRARRESGGRGGREGAAVLGGGERGWRGGEGRGGEGRGEGRVGWSGTRRRSVGVRVGVRIGVKVAEPSFSQR